MKSSGCKPAGAVAPRERKKAATRSRIVAAATKLFGGATYDAVQMSEVAAAAGIGKPSLYRYFPSKDELFLEIFDAALGELETALGGAASAAASPSDALARMVGLLVQTLRNHTASLRLLTGEHPALAARWRLVFRKRRRGIMAPVTAVLRAGVAKREFRAMDVDLVAVMLIGLVRAALMQYPEGPDDRIVDGAVGLALTGVARRR